MTRSDLMEWEVLEAIDGPGGARQLNWLAAWICNYVVAVNRSPDFEMPDLTDFLLFGSERHERTEQRRLDDEREMTEAEMINVARMFSMDARGGEPSWPLVS